MYFKVKLFIFNDQEIDLLNLISLRFNTLNVKYDFFKISISADLRNTIVDNLLIKKSQLNTVNVGIVISLPPVVTNQLK